MPPFFARGDVVVRDRRFAVVWQHDAAGIALLELCNPRQRRAHDVELTFAELLACGAAIAEAVVRPRMVGPLDPDGYDQVGTAPGPLMCRVVHGLSRVTAEQATHRRWQGDRSHRELARSRPVRP